MASNPGVTSYRWKQGSSVISSATVPEWTIGSVSRSSGGNYTCQGNNSIPTPAYSQPVRLVVQFGPSVSLPTSTQTVTEGTTLTVNCTVDSNPPASSVIWTKKDDNTFRQDSTTLTILGIQKSQAGEYVCTANNTLSPCGLASIQRTGTDEVRVDVQYKSTITDLTLNSASGSVTVNESAFLNLTCQVDSNPGSTIRLMNGSQELRRTDNSLTASHSWVAHCRQRGNYSCTASNIIGAAVNNIIELAVKCAPRTDETFTLQHQYASHIGGNVTMSVPVLAYPVPTFTWSTTSSMSQDLNGSFIPVSDISVNAMLKLKHLQQEDFGDYNLTVENGVGEPMVFTVAIVPEGPPEMPTNLTVTSDGPYSLLVAWKQGFDGGAKQTFTVEYSEDKVTWIIAGTKEESKNLEYQQLTIPKLEPSATYYMRVIARNKYGEKNYTESVAGRTKELEKTTEPPGPGSSAALIGGGVTGGVAVTGLVVVGAVLFLRRRNKDKDTAQNQTNGIPRKKKKGEDKLVMENDLYESAGNTRKADLVMEENVCYASSGDIAKSGPSGTQASGVSDVYAIVDKKKKTPEPSSDVYAKVEKKDKKQAGAKEKKKEKENKAKKPKPKDKKKKTKDDMIPLSKKRQDKNREEYINTEMDKDGNPYINYAFDDQSENVAAASAQPQTKLTQQNEMTTISIDSCNNGCSMLQSVRDSVATNCGNDYDDLIMGAKTGRDEDGCVYLDLDFTGQKSSTEVKGEEESTEYAAIQIGVVGPKMKDDEKDEKEEAKK